MHSIRFRITAITILACLITLLCVNIFDSFTLREEAEDSAVEQLDLLASDAGKSLEKYLGSIEQSVETAANIAGETLDNVLLVRTGAAGPARGERTPEQTAALDEYLAAYCDQMQRAITPIAGYSLGVTAFYFAIDPVVSQQVPGFLCIQAGKAGYRRAGAPDLSVRNPDDPADASWYDVPVLRGRPTWFGPCPQQLREQEWVYSYLVPVYASGTVVGVLGMDIPVDTLVDQVSPIRVYETGFASLLDPEGRIIYHPTLETGTVPDPTALNVPEDTFRQKNSAGTHILYTFEGVERQLAFTTLGNGMKLVVAAPTAEIDAPWTRILRNGLLVSAAAVLVCAVLVFFIMRYLTRPLLRLTAAARRLTKGDYDVALDYKGRDEVGALTDTFLHMRDRLRQDMEDLNRRVYTDDLTGLPNGRAFLTLALSDRDALLGEGKKPVMLYFDLVGMKHFNQQYGLPEGDNLLRAVGRLLADRYGENCVCRLAQDHFAVVTQEEGAEEGLREIFRQLQTVNSGRTLPVRVGIYRDSLGPVEVSEACDRAKYACDLHRNAYVSGYYFFEEGMQEHLDNLRYILGHLDQALRERWIAVYYQPIVRAANGKVCDEEALSRWIDPVRGPLPPSDFIPFLEDAGLIYRLDLYVLDRVLEKMHRQQREGLYVVPHSINLSRSDFDACDIVEEIRRRVDGAGISRDRITIEITESIIGSDFDFMKGQIERFQALGFPVWMDDFGSGYSSLDTLQDIRFDLIKFDMRFMSRFHEGDESRIILTELVRMAIGLGVDTVCEGVETEEQARFLREIGCTKLQGYRFCRPVPYETIVERNRTGTQIGFENPAESAYYDAIGRINLYDAAVLTREFRDSRQHYFNNRPMTILEVEADSFRFIRCNNAYRAFMSRVFDIEPDGRREVFEETLASLGGSAGRDFLEAVRRCALDGEERVVHETARSGESVRTLIRRLAVNPVTGAAALAIAVLSLGQEDAC